MTHAFEIHVPEGQTDTDKAIFNSLAEHLQRHRSYSEYQFEIDSAVNGKNIDALYTIAELINQQEANFQSHAQSRKVQNSHAQSSHTKSSHAQSSKVDWNNVDSALGTYVGSKITGSPFVAGFLSPHNITVHSEVNAVVELCKYLCMLRGISVTNMHINDLVEFTAGVCAANPQKVQSLGDQKKIPCKFHAKGICKFGDSCRYDHHIAETK